MAPNVKKVGTLSSVFSKMTSCPHSLTKNISYPLHLSGDFNPISTREELPPPAGRTGSLIKI